MDLFQVISDIHLERQDITEDDFLNIIIPKNEILILAGDIGDPFSLIYEKFISFCSTLFTHVLLISGNHEYYYNDITETDERILDLSKQLTNVHYLNNKIFSYNDIVFIGTTLWSDIEIENNRSLHTLQDFKKIKKFTPFIGNKMFENNVNFIKNEVEKHDKCIIITHHAPSYLCIPGCFDGDDLNSCFASKLDYLFEHKNMLGWIFGHTHHNIDIKMNEKFLYSNCYRGLFK